MLILLSSDWPANHFSLGLLVTVGIECIEGSAVKKGRKLGFKVKVNLIFISYAICPAEPVGEREGWRGLIVITR